MADPINPTIPSLRALATAALQNKIPTLAELAGAVVLKHFSEKNKPIPLEAKQPLLNIWNKMRDFLKVWGFDAVMWSQESKTIESLQASWSKYEATLEKNVDSLFLRFSEKMHVRQHFPDACPTDDCVHYARLYQKYEDEALQSIWNRLDQTFEGIPQLADLEAIKQWFEDPTNQPVLDQFTELDLSDLGLWVIPPQISKFTQLEELNLSKNHISAIPNFHSLGNLSQLTVLDLSHNKIPSFPKSLSQLTQLQKLNLGHNRLPGIPDSMGDLTQLQELYLNHNSIPSIPGCFANFRDLEVLDLSHNNIRTISEPLSQLKELVELNISHNDLNTIPSSLGSLANLQKLNLSHNRIKSIHDSFGNLENLEVLFLGNNLFSSIPAPICRLTALKVLSLCNNELGKCNSFPIGNANPSQYLPQGNNPIKSIHSSIGNYQPRPVSFNIPTSCFPETFGDLINLEEIDLSGNYIKNIPEFFKKFQNLIILHFNDNYIENVPDVIGDLRRLKSLSLEKNQIQEIPDSLGKLQRLQKCNFSDNRLTSIPKSLYTLSHLRKLYLQNNLICAIPNAHKDHKLKRLREVDLSNNHLSCLPDWVESLPELKLFGITNNPLMFVFHGKYLTENGSELIESYNSFKASVCTSEFSKFCKIMSEHDFEAVKTAFQSLKSADKQLVIQLVSSNSKNIDLPRGADHVFDSRAVFYWAVRKAISVKFERLSEDKKSAVYGHIYQLAGSPQADDPNIWGKEHAFDNVLWLIDAMDKV